jgi:nitrite reductase/ring-hydroxylating ferredoxin subunit
MRKSFLILLTAAICFISCGKTGDVVPNVSFTFTASKFAPSMAALNSPNGSVVMDGYGVAGIVIYRTNDLRYVAYDRCSSYQPEKRCAVVVDESTGFTATDPCSGSKFSLTDGSPVKAPATRSLRAYVVNVSQFEITVSNY